MSKRQTRSSHSNNTATPTTPPASTETQDSQAEYDPDFDVDIELELDDQDRKLANPLRTSIDERDPLDAEPIPVQQFEVFDCRPGPTTRKWQKKSSDDGPLLD